jgi:hypothetical protein
MNVNCRHLNVPQKIIAIGTQAKEMQGENLKRSVVDLCETEI